MKSIPCAFCGVNDNTILFVGEDYTYRLPGRFNVVKCNRCGLICTNPQPTEDELQKYYPPEYTAFGIAKGTGHKWVKRLIYRRILCNISKIIKPDARILEIGCGNAEFLSFLKDKTNYELTGIEPNKSACQRAKDKFGLNIICGDLKDISLPDGHFDLVVMKYVLEHFIDPNEALSKIHKTLKQNAKILIWVPNFNSLERRVFGRYWHGFELPRHLYHFSDSSVKSLLNKWGFHVRKISYDFIPNNLIWSLKYFCREKGMPNLFTDYFNIDNFMLLMFFYL